MTTLFRAAFLTVLFVLMFSRSLLAWDAVGHETTAYIAWQRMTPEARAAVIKILRAGPEDSDISTFYIGGGAESDDMRKLEYFMLMATWADIIRDRSFETRYRKYHKSNWHYEDTFWKQVGDKIEIIPNAEEGGQAINRLLEYDKVMRNASASDKDRAVAIAWVMHLVGDIHQPLHTSGRVTDLEPKGDQGGNLFLLSPQGTPREDQVNLHWLWDSIVIRTIPPKGDVCERDYIASVAHRIMKRYPYNSLSSSVKPSSYENWRKESFELATTRVYTPDLVRFQMPSAKYKKNALRVAERQLALAGYRLADTLNQIFSAPPAASPAK
jgi:hypothetical protein